MPLPTLFASLTSATGAMLDGNFAALGAISPIPCAVSGTNALTLTPALAAPTVVAYANYGLFSGVAVANSSTSVTAQVGVMAPLAVFKDTAAGPAALTGGEIRAGNVVGLLYDSSLAAGAGGFHLTSLPTTGIAATGSPVAGNIAQWTGPATLGVVATTGAGNVVLATAPIINGATILGGSVAAQTLQSTFAYTVAGLPAASVPLRGQRAYVTDASVATAPSGTALVGAGANTMPVFCNGTAWVYG